MRFVIAKVSRSAFVSAAGFVLFAATQSTATAQVSLNPGIGQSGDQFAVCAFGAGGDLNIAEEDDCEGGTNLLPTTGLTVGPSGSQTFLDSSNGTATFGAAATFNNATATFNAGLTSTAVTTSNLTVNGPSTFNGGVSVQSGQTVSFNGNRLQGVGTPTTGTDAANKQYVDDENSAQNLAIGNQQTQIDSIVTVNSQQDARLTTIENVNASQQVQINQNAADIFSLQSDVQDLQQRDDELAEGIAIALALDAPLLKSGQTFAMRGGWGNFEGSNAAGVTAAGAISQNVVVDAGVGWGTSQGTIAGKAGVTVGW